MNDETVQKCKRAAAIFVLGMFFSAIVGIYASALNWTQLWLWLWVVLFFWFVNSKASIETRGIVFLVLSAFCAVAGKAFLQRVPHLGSVNVLDLVSQIMLLIGGGVGASFIASGLLKEQSAKKAPNNSLGDFPSTAPA